MRTAPIIRHTLRLFLLMALLLSASVVLAQSGGGYDLSWATVDGGGATFSTGGDFSLGGAIGQPDAGALSGGGYTLLGGFWSGGNPRYDIYLPLTYHNS